MANDNGPGDIPTFSGLPHERLEDYERDLKAYVLGTRDLDRPLIGPRLLRRLGGLPGELIRREVTPESVAKEDGFEVIIAKQSITQNLHPRCRNRYSDPVEFLEQCPLVWLRPPRATLASSRKAMLTLAAS